MSQLLPKKLQKSKLFSNIIGPALIISIFTLAITLGPQMFFKADAGTFTSAKVTISDSRAGTGGVSYAFSFAPTGTGQVKQLTIKFCTESSATGTCTTPTSMVTTTASRASDNIDGTGRTDNFAANGTLTTTVTTPADQTTTPITATYNSITNPATANTTYYARITSYSDTGTTIIDSAVVAFAILTSSSMTVTATVDPVFTISIAGVNSNSAVNGATINATGSTTASTIPFGTMSDGVPKIAAHDVTVSTNAQNGYIVTVKKGSTEVMADGSNNFDPFTATGGTPTVWSAPGGSSANVNTAFVGYTTEDTTLTTAGGASRFSSNKWAGIPTSAEEIIGRSNGTGSEVVRVGWQSEINELQPPGNYTGTVILVATPTY